MLFEDTKEVTIIDAVMGTGKSRYISLKIIDEVKKGKKYVLVVPLLSEIKRYKTELQSINGLVALDTQTSDGKRQAFHKAVLNDSQVIIITHQLFSEHISNDTLLEIDSRDYNLVLDETLQFFSDADLDILQVSGMLYLNLVKEELKKENLFLVKPINYSIFKLTSSPSDKGARGAIMKKLSLLEHNDLYIITESGKLLSETHKDGLKALADNEETEGASYSEYVDTLVYPISCRAITTSKFTIFNTITALTYPFLGSPFEAWLMLNEFKVNHHNLLRLDSTDSLPSVSM